MTTIVLATQNPGKIRELRAMLEPRGAAIKGLDDFGRAFDEPDEDGGSFLANATIKAVAYASMTDALCLADDSGLEIDALGGAPGVISSHYAFGGDPGGEAAILSREQRDHRNIDRVLEELDPHDFDARTARFVCTMVLADPSGKVLATSEGAFEGRIGFPITDPRATPATSVPRGEHGFGYDPVFLVAPEHDRTSAQLDPEAKNAISHRAKALRSMITQFERLDLV